MIVEPKESKVRYSFQFPEQGISKCGFHVYIHIDIIRYMKAQCTGEGNRTWVPDLVKLMGQKWFNSELTMVHYLISRDTGLIGITCAGNACGLDIGYHEWEHAQKEDRDWIRYDPHNVDSPSQALFLCAMVSWLDGFYEGRNA